MHGLNSSYGHKAILASYAGVAHEYPIWGFVQHGWTPFDGWTERKKLPKGWSRFVWSSDAATRRPADRPAAPYVTIGSPLAYLVTHLGGHLVPSAGDGCIAFPLHAGEQAKVIGSHAGFARELRDREGRGVDVCLYWTEMRDAETRAAYERYGHNVVSVGTDRTDRYFLVRWLRLLHGKGRAVSNRVSTSVIYAASLGLDVEIYGDPMRVVGAGESTAEAHDHGRDLLPASVNGRTTVPPAWARRELGFDELLTPDALATVLGWRGWRQQLGPLAVAGINTVRTLRGGTVHRDG